MGFGKMWSLKVDAIPGKLAYFVVDNFDPNRMEIRFGRLAIKLLYVDSVTCKGINEDRTISPLEYWTMQRLQQREDMESEQGGFRRGDFRGLFVDEGSSNAGTSEEPNSEKTKTEESGPGVTNPNSLEAHLRDVGTHYY
ncbi:hypothetical protein Hdeb2414_s0022g00612641 [Helianthus debilis subsp. tardiflorus]